MRLPLLSAAAKTESIATRLSYRKKSRQYPTEYDFVTEYTTHLSQVLGANLLRTVKLISGINRIATQLLRYRHYLSH